MVLQPQTALPAEGSSPALSVEESLLVAFFSNESGLFASYIAPPQYTWQLKKNSNEFFAIFTASLFFQKTFWQIVCFGQELRKN